MSEHKRERANLDYNNMGACNSFVSGTRDEEATTTITTEKNCIAGLAREIHKRFE